MIAKRSRWAWRWISAASIAVALLMGTAGGAWGQGAMPDDAAMEEAWRLNVEASRLYTEGKYDEAIPLVERALAIRERVRQFSNAKIPCFDPGSHPPESTNAQAVSMTAS